MLNIKKAIELLKNGVDISITSDGKIYRSNDISYNDGTKIKAIFTENMTNKEISNRIREIRKSNNIEVL